MAWPVLIISCLFSIASGVYLRHYASAIEKFMQKNNLPRTVLGGISMNRFIFYFGVFAAQPEWAKSGDKILDLLTKFRSATITFIASVFAGILSLLLIIWGGTG